MTGRLQYMGERTDLAAANKLFGNAMIIGLSATLADVLTLAQASNVDAARPLSFKTTGGTLRPPALAWPQ